jgi:hypothetical protein
MPGGGVSRFRFDSRITCASGCTNPVLNIFTVSAQSNSRYYMAEIQTEMVENVIVYITKYIFVRQCATPLHFPIIQRQNGANSVNFPRRRSSAQPTNFPPWMDVWTAQPCIQVLWCAMASCDMHMKIAVGILWNECQLLMIYVTFAADDGGTQ